MYRNIISTMIVRLLKNHSHTLHLKEIYLSAPDLAVITVRGHILLMSQVNDENHVITKLNMNHNNKNWLSRSQDTITISSVSLQIIKLNTLSTWTPKRQQNTSRKLAVTLNMLTLGTTGKHTKKLKVFSIHYSHLSYFLTSWRHNLYQHHYLGGGDIPRRRRSVWRSWWRCWKAENRNSQKIILLRRIQVSLLCTFHTPPQHPPGNSPPLVGCKSRQHKIQYSRQDRKIRRSWDGIKW